MGVRRVKEGEASRKCAVIGHSSVCLSARSTSFHLGGVRPACLTGAVTVRVRCAEILGARGRTPTTLLPPFTWRGVVHSNVRNILACTCEVISISLFRAW